MLRPDLSGVDPLTVNLAQRCCVGDLLSRSAGQFPDRPALIADDRGYSYSLLESRTNSLGRGLLELGLRAQEPVAMLISNDVAFVETFFACAKAGLIALPINLALGAEEISFILEDSGARVMIAESRLVPATLWDALTDIGSLEKVILIGDNGLGDRSPISYGDLFSRDTSPLDCIVEDRDIVECLYTSGTTASPKGVLTSHLAVVIAVLSNALQLGHQRGEHGTVQPIVLPLFHTAGLNVLMLPTLLVGGTVVLFKEFEPAKLVEAIERYRATHVLLLPRMWQDILDLEDLEAHDVSSLILCMYAMAPMPPGRVERLRDAFPSANVLLGSGQTEFTPPTVMQWPPHQLTKPDSWGPPMATVDVRIMGPDGNMLPPREIGEIVYRGPQCMSGYWNRPEANVEAFRGGWLHSGDLGWRDEQGVVWFTDRLKDMVKSGGENVSSLEVEAILLSHPDVLDCAVVGMPDPDWGEAVTAVVVRRTAQVSPSALISHCRSSLAGYKVPKSVVFTDDLPRTSTGKIQKNLVRQQLIRSSAADEVPVR